MTVRTLPEPEAKALLHRAGVCVPTGGMVGTLEEALRLAEEIRYPVVLKAIAPGLLHKSDAGAVVLDVAGPDGLAAAYQRLLEGLAGRPGISLDGVLVERMMPRGTEIVVGARRDPQFGPVVVSGLGGIFVEVLRDVSCRVAPIDRRDAREMWQELKAAPLLTGARGRGRLDTDALEELLLIVSGVALDRPDLVELDLNPIILYPKGAVAVDALLVLDDPGDTEDPAWSSAP